LRNIGILAAAVLIIAATGIGNAFAYTWGGTDYSKYDNPNYASWVSGCDSTCPTLPSGTMYVTWANKFENAYGGNMYPTLTVTNTNDAGTQDTPRSTYLTVGGGAWSPDGSYPVEGSGWHCIHVKHYYGGSQGSKDYYASPFHQHDYTM
jgi:hypothetical protein